MQIVAMSPLSPSHTPWLPTSLFPRANTGPYMHELLVRISLAHSTGFGSGPVLFSMHINSLPDLYNYDKTLYADDTVISVTNELSKWMLFHNVNLENPVFRLNGVIIERVMNFQYLGLTINPALRFISHRKNVSNNLRNKVHQMANIMTFVDEDAALLVYNSMVIPTVDYMWDH